MRREPNILGALEAPTQVSTLALDGVAARTPSLSGGASIIAGQPVHHRSWPAVADSLSNLWCQLPLRRDPQPRIDGVTRRPEAWNRAPVAVPPGFPEATALLGEVGHHQGPVDPPPHGIAVMFANRLSPCLRIESFSLWAQLCVRGKNGIAKNHIASSLWVWAMDNMKLPGLPGRNSRAAWATKMMG